MKYAVIHSLTEQLAPWIISSFHFRMMTKTIEVFDDKIGLSLFRSFRSIVCRRRSQYKWSGLSQDIRTHKRSFYNNDDSPMPDLTEHYNNVRSVPKKSFSVVVCCGCSQSLAVYAGIKSFRSWATWEQGDVYNMWTARAESSYVPLCQWWKQWNWLRVVWRGCRRRLPSRSSSDRQAARRELRSTDKFLHITAPPPSLFPMPAPVSSLCQPLQWAGHNSDAAARLNRLPTLKGGGGNGGGGDGSWCCSTL